MNMKLWFYIMIGYKVSIKKLPKHFQIKGRSCSNFFNLHAEMKCWEMWWKMVSKKPPKNYIYNIDIKWITNCTFYNEISIQNIIKEHLLLKMWMKTNLIISIIGRGMSFNTCMILSKCLCAIIRICSKSSLVIWLGKYVVDLVTGRCTRISQNTSWSKIYSMKNLENFNPFQPQIICLMLSKYVYSISIIHMYSFSHSIVNSEMNHLNPFKCLFHYTGVKKKIVYGCTETWSFINL